MIQALSDAAPARTTDNPADGYEEREMVHGRKVPFYLHPPAEQPLSFAGPVPHGDHPSRAGLARDGTLYPSTVGRGWYNLSRAAPLPSEPSRPRGSHTCHW